MKMRDILFEWRNYISHGVIEEGGNATAHERDADGAKIDVMWKGQKAQARPMTFDARIPRNEFIDAAKDAIRKIDELHKEKFGTGIYKESARDDILDSGYTFMGSSEFLFSPEIEDSEYVKYKPKTGDIDLLIPKDKLSSLYQILNSLKMTSLNDRITFVGHNKLTEAQIREEQINAILEYSVPGRSFLFQIDFVFVPFNDEGKPFEEEKYLRGSTWEDIKNGIKGVGHKLLLQSLGSNIITIPEGSAVLATATSNPEKIRLQTSLPDINSKRIGIAGIINEGTPDEFLDMQSFAVYANDFIADLTSKEIKTIFELYTKKKKLSWQEIKRFFEDGNESLNDMLKQVLRKEGLSQNQNISILVSFIVDAPTVPDFKLEEYFKSFTSMMSFSMGRGLSVRYKKEPYQAAGKDVYRYLSFNEREKKFRKAEDIFEAIFQSQPSAEDVRDAASFLGLLRIINRHLDTRSKISAYDGLISLFYQRDNFMSAHDISDDLDPKEKIMSAFESAVPEVQSSEKFINKSEIVSKWTDRYVARLSVK